MDKQLVKDATFGHTRLAYLIRPHQTGKDPVAANLVLVPKTDGSMFLAIVQQDDHAPDYMVASLDELDRDWKRAIVWQGDPPTLEALARLAMTYRYVWEVGVDHGYDGCSQQSLHRTREGARAAYDALVAADEHADPVYCHARRLED